MYSEFREDMLSALYQEQMHNGEDALISFRDLADTYDIDWREGWLLDLQKSLINEGFLRGPQNSQNDEMAIGKLIGGGLQYIEDKHGGLDGVPTLIARRDEPLVIEGVADDANETDRVPENAITTEDGSPLVTEGGDYIVTEDEPDAPEVPSFASANWTGITDRLGAEHRARINDLSGALLAAVRQSDLDERSKITACKHIEAVQILLEAPDPPWKAIVELLNQPALIAFLTAVDILRLIWGAAS